MHRGSAFLQFLLGCALSSGALYGTASSEATRAIFEKRCFNCHGDAQTSGLDLRRLETIRKGGARGPAIVAGKADQSLLFQAVARVGKLQMPPGKPLPPDEVASIRQWINEGAPWEEPKADAPSWWAFQKVVRPAVPAEQKSSWVRTPIDAFVLRNLNLKGLKPVAAADRRTLVRRLYFNLLGLPPTPAEAAAFVNDAAPDAYEKLVDRLLASPRYGERWGRHWLDVVRYADTGGFETDMYYANAWRYRDYVIQSFNADKPYDQFLQEQIAGDELWPDDLELAGGYDIPPQKLKHLEARIGTALYTIGPTYHEAALNGEQLRYEWLTDAVDTTGQAFLGLTVGCARCHDHKFDPISQRDYHRMMAIFAGSEEREIPVVSKMNVFGFKSGYPNLLQVDDLKAAIQKIDLQAKDRATAAILGAFPPEVVTAYQLPAKERTPRQAELAPRVFEALTQAGLLENAAGKDFKLQYTPGEQAERDGLVRRLGEAALKASYTYPTATVLGHSDVIPEIHLTSRGDFHGNGAKVGAGYPKVLGGTEDIDDQSGSGFVPRRRRALALWLTQADHPLTARVMVNRLWAWNFGQGIVATPSDFGRQGDAPANPELLDWLASEFVSQGWSVKKLERMMLLSSTYRTASQSDPENMKTDPGNRFCWRFNRSRMEAEEIRDSVLSVAGVLNLKMGGRPVIPPLTHEEEAGMWALNQWPVSLDTAEHHRRSVYLYVKRSFPFPMFTIFDSPDSSQSCPRRDVTTVAPQALALINSAFMVDHAKLLAGRLEKEHPGNVPEQIQSAWSLVMGRDATEQENRNARTFLANGNLAQLCMVLLNTNEFLYIE